MPDFTPTNTKIAELLQQQTYAERMDMAQSLADVLNDAKANMSIDDGFEADDIAGFLEGWAEAEGAEEQS